MKRYLHISRWILFFSFAYCLNPPANGGAIPDKYIHILKSQNIIHDNNAIFLSHLNRSVSSSQSPPSNYNLPVLLVGFSDNNINSEIISKEEFQTHLFGNNISGSLTDYYNEVSYGKFNLTGDVYGWYESSYTEAMAVENTSGFIIDILNQADIDIDFSNYDNDGDGTVDGLMIVFPGLGADEDGADSGHIWPHMSTLWENGAPYSQLHDGLAISKYAICPEQRKIGNSSVNREIRPIGVFAHEFGHVLGLPDLYERSAGDEGAISEGIGEWCLMASGSWNGSDGDTPAHMSAWCKYQLGWSEPIVLELENYETYLNDDGLLVLENSAQNDNQIYKIHADGYRFNEYFLLENRQLVNFDSQLNGSGLLLYHIDEDQYWGKAAFWGGVNNDNYNHKLVDVEEADGLNDLDNSVNRGDAGDPYPGISENTHFDSDFSSNPNNYNYTGLSSSVNLNNITESNGLVTLSIDVPFRDGEVLSYNEGIASGYGYENIQDHTYAVKFWAPRDIYLNEIDIGLSQDNCNIDISIYRSMTNGYFTDNPINKLFSNSYENVSSGWNTFNIGSIQINAGEAFYIEVTNKESAYGWTIDLQTSDLNSYSYFKSPATGLFQPISFGNFCIRARIDSDGMLNREIAELPNNIKIIDAYPNPFNPIINFSYSISYPENIQIKLYDINGRFVSKLVDKFYTAGKYQISWDASNMSSGIYFAEYLIGNQQYTQKITLLK